MTWHRFDLGVAAGCRTLETESTPELSIRQYVCVGVMLFAPVSARLRTLITVRRVSRIGEIADDDESLMRRLAGTIVRVPFRCTLRPITRLPAIFVSLPRHNTHLR